MRSELFPKKLLGKIARIRNFESIAESGGEFSGKLPLLGTE
jgi:hypothetical protein